MVTDTPIVLRSGIRDEQPGCGHLLTPSTGGFERLTTGTWACDNDSFHGFKPQPYLRMLETVRGRTGCVFVTAPDVVENFGQFDTQLAIPQFQRCFRRLNLRRQRR